jgi:hypothetical protein
VAEAGDRGARSHAILDGTRVGPMTLGCPLRLARVSPGR